MVEEKKNTISCVMIYRRRKLTSLLGTFKANTFGNI